MPGILYYLLAGPAFFGGMLTIIAAACWRLRTPRRWTHRLATCLALVALLLVVVSATPLPVWYEIPAALITLVWLVITHSSRPPRTQRITAGMLGLTLLAGIGLELPWHFTPAFQPVSERRLTVLADSLTAGIGEGNVTTWPHLLAGKHHLELDDRSRMGATLTTARTKAEERPLLPGLVLVEIGGNDILGSPSPVNYRTGLDSLLSYLATHAEQVVLLELPLPPFHNEYGRIQRELARRYRIPLLPRRLLLDVITTGAGTIDSLHLTQTGQDRFADLLWQSIEPAFSSR